MGKVAREKREQLKEQFKNVNPIVRMKPEYGSNIAHFKVTKYIETGTRIDDDILEIDTPQNVINKCGMNSIYICELNEYVAKGKIFICNIPGGFILKNKKIPMYYLRVGYERKFLSGHLFEIIVSYDISDESFELKNNPIKYLKSQLMGQYVIEFMKDDDFMENFEKHMRPKYQDRYLKEFAGTKDVNQMADEEMDDIVKSVSNKINERFGEIKKIMEPITLTQYPHKSVLVKHMRDLCSNEIFIEMVRESILMRDLNRKSEAVETYDPRLPKRVFNIKELRENPDKIDEMLKDSNLNRSDDDTDYSESE